MNSRQTRIGAPFSTFRHKINTQSEDIIFIEQLGSNCNMKSLNRRYIPELDHIRAFAAVHVLLFHGTQRFYAWSLGEPRFNNDWWFETWNPLWAFIHEGHTGVTLFIVLSGFVLTLGFSKARIDDFSLAKYLLNRSLRIYPLFIFVIILGLLVFPERWSLSGTLLLVFAGKVPGATSLEHFTAVTWSVVVEDHCYLLFPFIAWALVQKRLSLGFALLFAALSLRVGLNLIYGPSFFLNYGSVFGRIDQFIIGAIAAIFFYEQSQPNWRTLLSCFGAVFAYQYAFHLVGPFPEMGIWRSLTPTLEAVLWASFIVAYIGVVKRFENWGTLILEKVGLISYSIYLMHIPVVHYLGVNGVSVDFLADPISNAFLNSLVFLLPATLVVATFTYWCVERPFLRLRKRYLNSGPGSSKKSEALCKSG